MAEIYACIECGFETPKWMGRCTRCGAWNTLKSVEKVASTKRKKGGRGTAKILKISTIKKPISPRIKTGFSELDRVLGGGITNGEVFLVGGEPGIGKTTLLLEVLRNLTSRELSCLYVSAEESSEQISLHAARVGLKGLELICESDIDAILSALSSKKYQFIVIDSIQTIKTEDILGLAGGVGQVKECASRIISYAKGKGVAVAIIGHITKEGDIAGPKVLEHLVDAVLYLEGDTTNSYRLLKGIKNRYGSTREIGVFNFSQEGFSDAVNPFEMFILSEKARVGICKGIISEGNRALLVEVQALISTPTFSVPQRIVSGLSKPKIQMLCALLSKYTKANLNNRDVYVNIANGINVKDASLDLAICFALLSSYFDKKADPARVAIGEVSLSGQIYATTAILDQIAMLRRLGYKKLVLPANIKKNLRGKSDSLLFLDSVAAISKFS